jgi:hypothetical protein
MAALSAANARAMEFAARSLRRHTAAGLEAAVRSAAAAAAVIGDHDCDDDGAAAAGDESGGDDEDDTKEQVRQRNYPPRDAATHI